MEVTGKIIAALPQRSGTSARTGNQWMSQEFVIETMDQYPRKMVFRIFGQEKLQQFNIQVGEVLTVSFDIDAHEYNGRWFNDISAWRVSRGEAIAAAPAASAAPWNAPAAATPVAPETSASPAAPSSLPEDDLPF